MKKTSFHKQLKKILDDEKPKFISRICNNFWCKGRYEVKEELFETEPEVYNQCKKCRSFSNEMSGGVTNNGQREYEGTRTDPEVFNKVHEGKLEFKSLGLSNKK